MKTTLWLFRLSLTVHAVCVLAQPILAGLYLDGSYDALGAHSLNGSILPATGMVVGAAALAFWIAGGAGWPLLAYATLWLAEGFQIGVGYARVLAIHLPLGVTIVVLTVWLTVWVWLPRAARRRRRRTSARNALDRLEQP
ncbi:hypothetical protein [Cryptosporangium arvum]|uniref:Uncharacterized protein n=1 Tax=Cryptosporangium arvum DSM 44712 TaxID=927661 RepID=A0A010ZKE6_9ACTN|nr:hypothetical protein [Cryptosporangium arvum]EXG79124.1 hypothetical protein CryarDRAFT_0147 [Cryptosporangium arvum DSM 44712]